MNQKSSRYDADIFARRGSRYHSEAYKRTGSRYKIQSRVERGSHDGREKQPLLTRGMEGSLGELRSSELAHMWHVGRKTRVLVSVAAVMTAVYLAGGMYYSSHYYPGTSVMGLDCGSMTAQQVRSQINDVVSWYRLAVTERSGEQDLIYASQIDLTYHDDQSLEETLKAQKSYLWPYQLLRGVKTQMSVSTDYSQVMLDEVLAELPCLDEESMIAPQDAYIAIEDNLLTVVSEVMGTTIDPDKASETITAALTDGLSEIDLDEAGCYVDPVVYQDDETLNRLVTGKNKVLGANFTIDFGEETEVIDTAWLADALSLDEDGRYYLLEETVWNYTAQLAEKYDTYGSERTFYTSLGTVETLSGIGDYGWQLDQDETAQLLLEAIQDKQTGIIEPVYLHTAKSHLADDIGDTYVEICISSQEMWMYKDGELLVDTAVVTGNPNQGNATPSGGVWAIDGKYTDFTLVGDTYRQFVNYWMPFNGGVGIHDLTSRAYYGGTIYLTNGSHGCVNTPLAAVALIYENVEVGTPVIVYEG